jgi:hypothetical protein
MAIIVVIIRAGGDVVEGGSWWGARRFWHVIIGPDYIPFWPRPLSHDQGNERGSRGILLGPTLP